MTKANIAKQELFLNAVKKSLISVYKSGKVINNKNGKELGTTPDNRGYHSVTVLNPKNKKYVPMLKHRLVWIIFKGNIIDPLIQINHKDGNKSNNKLSNLELTYNTGNVQHAWDTGLNYITDYRREQNRLSMQAENNILAKFSNEEVLKIREMFINKKISKKQIQIKYDVCEKTARNLIRGKTYSSILNNNSKHELKVDIVLKSGRPKIHSNKRILNMIDLRRLGFSNKEIAQKLNAHESTVSRKISSFLKNPKKGQGFYLKLNGKSKRKVY